MNAKLRGLLVIAGCMASVLTLGCKEEEAEEFGFTCLQLSRGEGVDVDPFKGTYEMIVTLNYEPCLINYYTKKHPEMRLDGPDDMGPAVFEEWRTRLCSENVPMRVECEIAEGGFQQTLMDTGLKANKLAITYRTPDPQGIAGRVVLWGPAPLTEYAECATGESSFAKLSTVSGVVGRDKDGNVLWQAQSFRDERGKIDSKGSGCIKAAIEPS
ncbi:MAG: hypothetical protein H0T76_09760 [Nannocystis sp.]|nr:hypothetical protein [Nannocystis sp.]MBA3546755.1 hypothetical protein [Nannocystis sp.]